MKTIQAIVTRSTILTRPYCGHTFDVVDMHPGGRISLSIEGATVDFSFSEVTLVGLKELTEKTNEYKNAGLTTYSHPKMPSAPLVLNLWDTLMAYARTKGINARAYAAV